MLASFGRFFRSIEVGRKYGPEPYNLKGKYALWNYRYSRPERKNICIFRGIFWRRPKICAEPEIRQARSRSGPRAAAPEESKIWPLRIPKGANFLTNKVSKIGGPSCPSPAARPGPFVWRFKGGAGHGDWSRPQAKVQA